MCACVSHPLGAEDGMWDLILLVPYQCFSFYLDSYQGQETPGQVVTYSRTIDVYTILLSASLYGEPNTKLVKLFSWFGLDSFVWQLVTRGSTGDFVFLRYFIFFLFCFFFLFFFLFFFDSLGTARSHNC